MASTGHRREPSGSTRAFGREPKPRHQDAYFQATSQDWWDEDAASPTYNTHTHTHGPNSPSSIAENLYDSGPVYDYAVNIASNPQRIPGKVAGIFLHVTDGNPTWGCVAIGRDEMRSVLNWLDPAAAPKITIGVGNAITGAVRDLDQARKPRPANPGLQTRPPIGLIRSSGPAFTAGTARAVSTACAVRVVASRNRCSVQHPSTIYPGWYARSGWKRRPRRLAGIPAIGQVSPPGAEQQQVPQQAIC